MHSSEDAPLVDLVWFRTDLPFQETESVINSNDWDEEPWRQKVVGEQYGYPRNYNGRGPIQGLTGDHQCGTQDDFEAGADWPYDGPPILYLPNGIPVCCGTPDIEVTTGGAMPASLVIRPYNRQANVSAGGRPASVLLPSAMRQANVSAGGRPASVLSGSAARTALVSAGGRPASVLMPSETRTALVSAGGRPASVLSGSTARTALVSAGGRPASVLSGSTARTALVSAGGRPASVLSGSAYSDPAEGGLSFGGEMPDDHTPGAPVPGNDCMSAGVIDFGVTYTHLMPAPGVSHWWTVPIATMDEYHVATTGINPPTSFVVGRISTDCSLIGEVVPLVPGPPCWLFGLPAGYNFYVVITSTDGIGTYTFEVGEGPC